MLNSPILIPRWKSIVVFLQSVCHRRVSLLKTVQGFSISVPQKLSCQCFRAQLYHVGGVSLVCKTDPFCAKVVKPSSFSSMIFALLFQLLWRPNTAFTRLTHLSTCSIRVFLSKHWVSTSTVHFRKPVLFCLGKLTTLSPSCQLFSSLRVSGVWR